MAEKWKPKPGERAMLDGRCYTVMYHHDEFTRLYRADKGNDWARTSDLTPPPEWEVIEAARRVAACGCCSACDALIAALARYDEVQS